MVKMTQLIVWMIPLAVMISDCRDSRPTAPNGYDLDRLGTPRLVTAHYIDPGRMARVSRFRSGYGTDYSDDFEQCRSMKHAFEPRKDFDWSLLPVYAPVKGAIIRIIPEAPGFRIHLQSHEYPDFEFCIFHVNPLRTVAVGQSLEAGQQIGTHCGSEILSEIAVWVGTTQGRRLVSYFDVLADSLMPAFNLCGVPSRMHFIITRDERDQDPLTCDGETFVGSGSTDDWVNLNCRYDVDAWGIPKFVNAHYIELDRIWRISRFRSSVGHDYSDDFEDCRSMKHYYQPIGNTGWETVRIFSPVTGTVTFFFDEWLGTQVWIQSKEYPDFDFCIFHIHLGDSLYIGKEISAGQLLGTHAGSRTYSDIAVVVWTPRVRKLISHFDTMSDSLFADYQARGLRTRGGAIISREERDAHPLSCRGEAFLPGGDTLPDWVYLD